MRCRESQQIIITGSSASEALPWGLANAPASPTGAGRFASLGLWAGREFDMLGVQLPLICLEAWTPTEALGDPGVKEPLFLRG